MDIIRGALNDGVSSSGAGSPEATAESDAPSDDAAAGAGALELPPCGTTMPSPPLRAKVAFAEAGAPPEASPTGEGQGELPLDTISLPSDMCVKRRIGMWPAVDRVDFGRRGLT
ncbi:hypothetical protein V7S43_011064 [Phytophthora oleae]|uniref:Uncharacterized protein n=1 Tax=Phytophthora oleae TaxID=2107226 RepID=A0ABD3FF75_9STRA